MKCEQMIPFYIVKLRTKHYDTKNHIISIKQLYENLFVTRYLSRYHTLDIKLKQHFNIDIEFYVSTVIFILIFVYVQHSFLGHTL
jgi:hypothetical protein